MFGQTVSDGACGFHPYEVTGNTGIEGMIDSSGTEVALSVRSFVQAYDELGNTGIEAATGSVDAIQALSDIVKSTLSVLVIVNC